MRTKDIAVGNVYYVNVGGRRVEVRVIRDRGGRGRRYMVERTDNKQVLPALRAGSAIHEDKEGYWPGTMEPREKPKGLGQAEGEYEYPSDEELYESILIKDDRGSGYNVATEGKSIAQGVGWGRAIQAARKWMKKNEYWPNIYYVNERGNVDLLDHKGNIIRSWV